jgi:SAM-dependent methyltransferase
MTAIQSAGDLDAHYREADPWGYRSNADDIRRRQELLGALPRRPFERVLDIGCGNGFVTLALPGQKVVGVDISKEALRWASLASAEEPNPGRFEFLHMSILEPEFERLGRFDLIVVTGVLYPQYVGGALSVVRENIDKALQPEAIIASCHIREWVTCRLPYSLLDVTLYPYRGRTHQLEIYRR